MRCAMNFGMDYYLFGNRADSITVMAKRIIDFFEKDEYQHARFNWDGTDPSESYTLGETGCNAVACYALMDARGYDEKIKRKMAILSVFSRLFGIHDEDFIVTFPRIQVHRLCSIKP